MAIHGQQQWQSECLGIPGCPCHYCADFRTLAGDDPYRIGRSPVVEFDPVVEEIAREMVGDDERWRGARTSATEKWISSGRHRAWPIGDTGDSKR